ncbi:MAG: hypothetical protein UW45_C0010G0020 [Parcubacteria group bacterium GW2011_GWC2_44_22]|nr:MAG: hypothetical protein UW45_C0010G0020 [Parcubacteria group bacterium GW2011_GWC2_44_22]
MDAFSAGQEAARQAMGGLKDKTPADIKLILVFSSVVFDQNKMLSGVRSITENIPLLGCSSAGEITTAGPSKKSVVVMAIATDSVTFNLAMGGNIKEDALAAGRTLAEGLKAVSSDGKLAIMLPDGLAGNGADIVRGLQQVLGENFPIVGGAAGDDFLFKETYEYYNDQVLTGVVIGAMLGGEMKIGIGVRHGWQPIGPPRKVTKSKGAVLYELDGKPAVQVYEEYFGKKAEELKSEPLARLAITYPLGLRIAHSDEYLIRDPITVGESGELTCAAEVPEGAEINLMMGSRENAIDAARQAAERCLEEIKEQGGNQVTTAIVFNCIARSKVLGRDAQKEIDAIKKVLGESAQLVGFYTYGEQAPIGAKNCSCGRSCKSEFCNETVVILGFGE